MLLIDFTVHDLGCSEEFCWAPASKGQRTREGWSRDVQVIMSYKTCGLFGYSGL